MADGAFAQEALEQIPAGLQKIADAGDMAGFVTMIWRKGEVIQLNTIGKRNIEDNLPMTRDTMFRIASMTKPMTSVTALQMIEQGKLKLDDPIAKWIPECAEMRVLEDANGPLDKTVPAERLITIEDLMTHRSGFIYAFTSVGPLADAYDRDLGSPIASPHGPDEWLKRIAKLPLANQPGERFTYSHSTDVLGFILGRIEGKPFRNVLKERVIDPLGMSDTDFWIPPEKRSRAARVYRAGEKLTHADWDVHNQSGPADYCSGGGGLISTVDDYLKFARAMVGRGEADGVRLISTDTFEMLRTNRLTPAQRQLPLFGIPYWGGQGFGLGVATIMDPEKHAWLGAGDAGSFSWPGAFGTWFQVNPAQEMVLIYLVQNELNLSAGGLSAVATGAQRVGGRVAQPLFQKGAYAALGV